MDEQVKKIQIKIPDEVLKGHYANIVHVNSGKEEFVLDFGVLYPAQGIGMVTDRIFMNPAHVKRLIDVLQKQMHHYEKTFGTVTASEPVHEIGFKTPAE